MAQTTGDIGVAKLFQFPVNSWDRHVRVASSYVIGGDPAGSQRFMRTESRRLAVALRCKGLDPTQVEETVRTFVADVGSRTMLHEALRASGTTAELFHFPKPDISKAIAR